MFTQRKDERMNAIRPNLYRLAALATGFFVVGVALFWTNHEAQAALLPNVSPEAIGYEQLQPKTKQTEAALAKREATITAPAQLSTVRAESVSVRSMLGVPEVLKSDIDVAKPINPAPRQALPKRNPYKYIVIDLSEQMVYAKEDGLTVYQALISSGLTGPTPLGRFKILTRYYNTCMSGPDYHLCNIHYTQYFTPQGHALHEKWWNNIYGRPTSHGCVNMTYKTAEWFWYWANIGTDIYIQQ